MGVRRISRILKSPTSKSVLGKRKAAPKPKVSKPRKRK